MTSGLGSARLDLGLDSRSGRPDLKRWEGTDHQIPLFNGIPKKTALHEIIGIGLFGAAAQKS